MDLKGSLVNTSLRIYPSEKCVKFLDTLANQAEVPQNILKLLNINKSDKVKNDLSKESINIQVTTEDIKNLNQIKELMGEDESQKHDIEKDTDVSDTNDSENVPHDIDSKLEPNVEKTDTEIVEKSQDKDHLTTKDIEWIYGYLKSKRSKGEKVPYLHELLEGAKVETPENQVLKRNPTLEARCVKLRAQQEAREYRAMTKGVDNVRIRFPEDTIAYQLKQMNRQLIAVGQFLLSIFAGFLFGFKGVEWLIGPLDFGFRLLLGVMCALVIALAEIYFLAKKLNEELTVPETVQIGGPPKFLDTKKYGPITSNGKEHQD